MSDKIARRGRVFVAIDAERRAQDELHDNSRIPYGTSEDYRWAADQRRDYCNAAIEAGRVTWRDIFLEEVFEAMAEEDPEKLKAELTQAVAVGVAWLEEIERREHE